MDKLQEQLIKSGILDQAQLDQMQQWSMLPKGALEKAGQGSAQELVDYLKQEGFDQQMPVIRETMLDIDRIMESPRAKRRLFFSSQDSAGLPLWAGRDLMGRFYVRIPYKVEPVLAQRIRRLVREGTHIKDLPGPTFYSIEDVSLLYEEKIPMYWMCHTKKIKAKGGSHE
jgi:hypothetical protein